MPEYENPEVPEGINVSEEHPLKEFILLACGIGAAVAVVLFALTLLAQNAAKAIPFEMEKKLAANAIFSADTENLKSSEFEKYLSTLANKLAKQQGLPEGMTITLHYSNQNIVNAFATLGGHIFVYRGLIDKLPHENALAMVIAHEIAHIRHRDPIIAMGRGATMMLILALFTGGDSAVAQQFLGQIGLVTALNFNREQELAADVVALETLQAYYGHVNGAEVLFEVLGEEEGEVPLAFLSTHPMTQSRIDHVISFRDEHDGRGELTPLPEYQ
ncbi:MAG: M48 family metallopeptidase [Pseudomonadales bacterium]|nr:M48 family metallopeptidase [Pseudomonadales bacterium]